MMGREGSKVKCRLPLRGSSRFFCFEVFGEGFHILLQPVNETRSISYAPKSTTK